jgi:hypothetical protein
VLLKRAPQDQLCGAFYVQSETRRKRPRSGEHARASDQLSIGVVLLSIDVLARRVESGPQRQLLAGWGWAPCRCPR